MSQNSRILYDCRWSDDVDTRFIKDFIKVEREVFGEYSEDNFTKKYRQNIYGPSIVCIVYIEGIPSAARALWRNDLDGREAYQPVETCVLAQCRGKGVFSEMTKRAISMISSEAVIYNFPNHNSFPGYLKLGWKSVREYRMVLLTSLRDYKQLHPRKMDKQYADWWLEGRTDLRQIKRFGTYFLVKKYPRPGCWKVLSEVDESIAKQFPRLKRPALIFYSGLKSTFYNKRFATAHVVAKVDREISIPVWKMDVI